MHRRILYMDPEVMERSVDRVIRREQEIEEIRATPSSQLPTIVPSAPVLSLQRSKSITSPSKAPLRLPNLPGQKKKPLRLQRVERPNGRPLTATNSLAATSHLSTLIYSSIPYRLPEFPINEQEKSSVSRLTADSFLVRSADSVELSMLRSIARLRLGSRQTTRSFDDSLREHEYEDLSDEEILENLPIRDGAVKKGGDSMKRNAISAYPHGRLTKQNEIEGTPQATRRRAHSAQNIGDRHLIREMEDRLQGFRHEKTSSTQRSQKSTDLTFESTTGLIYDADFDCYYCPDDDTYYRLADG